MTKLLIIDDKQEYVKAFVAYFEATNYDVVGVTNWESALETLKKLTFDVIVCTPEINGKDVKSFLIEVMRRNHHVTIIISSDDKSVTKRLQFLSFGVDDYLLKPISFFEFKLRIERFTHYKSQIATVVDSFHKTSQSALELFLTSLTRQEQKVLTLFLKNRAAILSIDFIKRTIGVANANSTAVLIHRINRKLTNGGGQCYIKSCYGRGYTLEETVDYSLGN